MDTIRRNRGAFLVAIVANIGPILFGFDTGVAGGVIALRSFAQQFELTGNPQKLAVSSSNFVAVFNAGAFFGCILPSIVGYYAGRRHMLASAGLLGILGGALQTAARPPSLSMLYAGRVIAGFTVGIISNVSPVFVAECSPRHLRGAMMSMFEFFLVAGGMLAYWMTYGCSLHISATSSRQWRIALSIQIVLAGIVAVSAWLVPESPRWLMRNNRLDEARRSLAFLRALPESDKAVSIELAEIRAQIDEELAITRGRSPKELLVRRNFQRLCWGLGAGFFSIWSGHNAILYYGPTVFRQIGFVAQNASLFATGMITIIKLITTIIFIILGVSHFRRKRILLSGNIVMAIFMFGLAATLATNPPHPGSNNTPAGRGMMALVYLFIWAYSWSYGPVAWLYIGEIFPARIRDYGMTCCLMVIWSMNFIVTRETPIMIVNIGWKIWIVYGTMNVVGALYAFFMPETKDVKLEDMDLVFGVVDEGTRRRDVEGYLGRGGGGGGVIDHDDDCATEHTTTKAM